MLNQRTGWLSSRVAPRLSIYGWFWVYIRNPRRILGLEKCYPDYRNMKITLQPGSTKRWDFTSYDVMFAYLIKDPITLYGDNDTATAQAREKRVTPKSRHTRIKYHYTREVIRAKEAQTIRVPTGDNISDAHSKAVSKPVWEFLVGKMSGYEPIFPYRPSLWSEVLFNLLRVQRERGSVDLYPSIVLLAWSLARSDEIDLSAIAVKREILQFVIAYCSLDL